MAQPCPSCLWLSADDAEQCERCGQPFAAAEFRLVKPGAVGGALRGLAAALAAVVLAFIVAQRFGDGFPGLWEALKQALREAYVWLLGPGEIYKPYLVSMLVGTAVIWLLLWLAARLRG